LLGLRAAAIIPLVQDVLASGTVSGAACALAIALPLALGGFTRVAAVLAAAWAIFHALSNGSTDLILAWRLLDAAALAVLGPGGLSLDAVFFGRRVVRVLASSKE
jgi:hypothetical protein